MKNFIAFIFALISSATFASAQVAAASASPSPAPSAPPAAATANNIVVTSQELDLSREQIVPSLGATRYTVGPDRISQQAQGEDAPFNQTILRFPGVTQDSFGQLHVRGEHANLQYRIDDVLLPEGITGFGQELSTRFVDNISLITGALPAQFGFRTTGVIDIHTKSGAAFTGADVSLEVGSFDTFMPSVEYGGVIGQLTYYGTASYLHSGIGIENPTRSSSPIHDDTDQFKQFAYLSYIIDDSSRLTLLLSGNESNFEIPNNPGQTPAFVVNGETNFDSAKLNENQAENSSYAILAYQKKSEVFNVQASIFTRYSGVLFRPDNVGDLFFNGVASRVDRQIYTHGAELDMSYNLNDQNTVRGGLFFNASFASAGTLTSVFPVDAAGSQTSDVPLSIADNSNQNGYFYGSYLQDEWKPFEQLTINFGGRFDLSDEVITESQFSPRVNVVYTPWKDTSIHAGYARYFTPPPLENVNQSTIARFAGTTNESAITTNSPVKAERANYFDAGFTQKIGSDFQIGLDGYYKHSRNVLDEGQFGTALILSSFNYREGEIYGGELSASYSHGGFSSYLNVGVEHATGEHVSSAQFLFDPDELAYISDHSVFLDHDQRVSASAGASYYWQKWTFSADALYGNGLRSGFANTQKLHPYETLNLGVERDIPLGGVRALKVRFDVVNLLDKIYELRDGSGIGVGAPQYGQRRGFYGTVSYTF
ncbi:MAG: TonB-dependent receptor [Chthoniobacterales bacterium]|nr:TonB-dependent receptor [Chthoniobacterales bacterium]